MSNTTNDANSNNEIFDNSLEYVLKIPTIIIDRKEFLEDILKENHQDELTKIIKGNILDYLSFDEISKIAENIISSDKIKGALVSAALGIPGGLAIPVTASADIVSYIYRVIVFGQKICYLYGFPNLTGTLKDKDDLKKFINLILVIACGEGQHLNYQLLITLLILKCIAPNINSSINTQRNELNRILKINVEKYGIRLLGNILPKLIAKLSASTFSKLIPIVGGIFNGVVSYNTLATDFEEIIKAFEINKDFLKEVWISYYAKTSTNTSLLSLPYLGEIIDKNIKNSKNLNSNEVSINIKESVNKNSAPKIELKEIQSNNNNETMDDGKETIKQLLKLTAFLKNVNKVVPKRGAIIYCNMNYLLNIEHTGIYVGGDDPNKVIIDLHKLRPLEKAMLKGCKEPHFGWNNAYIINYSSWKDFFDKSATNICYFAYSDHQIICNEEIAQKAEKKLNEIGEYKVLSQNCHIFTQNCLSERNINEETIDLAILHINPNFHFSNVENILKNEYGFTGWQSYQPIVY